MNLIDCSYFQNGPLQIENAGVTDDLDNNAVAVQEAIQGYIEHYQGEFLRKMLGDTLAATVMVGDVNQTMTVTGLMRIKSANDNQPPRQRMVSVWNDMVALNRQFVKWADTSDYEVFYHVNMVTPINQFNI